MWVYAFGSWWVRRSHGIFFVLFLCVIVIAAALWYWSVHIFRWNAAEESSYRASRNTQVKFQRDRFERAIGLLKDRSLRHEKLPEIHRDLFFGE